MGNWSVIEEWPKLSNHVGQECLLDKPNNRVNNPEVSVHDPVPKAPDPVPVNLRIAILELLWKPVGCLTNDFEVADHCINSLAVFCKVLEREAFGVTQDFASTIQHVTYQELGFTLRHKRSLVL